MLVKVHSSVNVIVQHTLNKIVISEMTSSRRERKIMPVLSKIEVFIRFGLWRQEFM